MGRGMQGKYNFRPPPEKVWPPVEGPDVTDAGADNRDGVVPQPEPKVPGEEVRRLMQQLQYMDRQGVNVWPPVEGPSALPIQENIPKPYGPERR